MRHLQTLLKTSRPISWVNTAYPFAAGYLVMQRQIDLRLVLGTLYFLIPYNILMYGINDVFDYESDRRNPRKGGLQGGVLERPLHRWILWAAAITNVPFVTWLLVQGSLVSNIVLLAVLFAVVAYSAPILRFKERPLLDSMTSSTHFVGPLLYALAITKLSSDSVPILAAFFCWGMASHAFGAVQDVLADRQAHIGSIATVIGAQKTVRLAVALYSSAIILLLISTPNAWPIALCGLLYIFSIVPYWNCTDTTAEKTQVGWRRFLWLNFITGAVITIFLLLHAHLI
jgi:4-hydroxybenzoate polyprenyltransferase